jgi:hypothetical protein
MTTIGGDWQMTLKEYGPGRRSNPGSAITGDYASPFKFTGTIHSVTVDVSGELIHDPEAELRMHMARQ